MVRLVPYRVKIFILDTAYRQLIHESEVASRNPKGSAKSSFAASLLQGVSGAALAKVLRRQGHDVQHVVANARDFQLYSSDLERVGLFGKFKWRYWQAISRVPLIGRAVYESSQLAKTFMRQIVEYQPDIIYVLNPNLLTPRLCAVLAKDNFKLVGQIASPLPPLSYFKHYSLMISALPSQVRRLDDYGVPSKYLPLAIDDDLVPANVLDLEERPIDISFVGSFGRHHKRSLPLVQAIAGAFPQLRIYTHSGSARLKKLGLGSQYAGKAWGVRTYEVYANSKIVLNRHVDIAKGYAVNLRMYEATAAGAVLLTEAASNLGDLFEPNYEVLAYANVEEAVHQISKVLQSHSFARKVATAGRARLKSHHVLSARAAELEEILVEVLGSRDTKRRTSSKKSEGDGIDL